MDILNQHEENNIEYSWSLEYLSTLNNFELGKKGKCLGIAISFKDRSEYEMRLNWSYQKLNELENIKSVEELIKKYKSKDLEDILKNAKKPYSGNKAYKASKVLRWFNDCKTNALEYRNSINKGNNANKNQKELCI